MGYTWSLKESKEVRTTPRSSARTTGANWWAPEDSGKAGCGENTKFYLGHVPFEVPRGDIGQVTGYWSLEQGRAGEGVYTSESSARGCCLEHGLAESSAWASGGRRRSTAAGRRIPTGDGPGGEAARKQENQESLVALKPRTEELRKAGGSPAPSTLNTAAEERVPRCHGGASAGRAAGHTRGFSHKPKLSGVGRGRRGMKGLRDTRRCDVWPSVTP